MNCTTDINSLIVRVPKPQFADINTDGVTAVWRRTRWTITFNPLHQFFTSFSVCLWNVNTILQSLFALLLPLPGWGMSPCPKWRSLSTSGFCSRVSGGVRVWRKGSWAGRQSAWSTGQSSSPPSALVMSHERWVMTKRTTSQVQAAKMGFSPQGV